MRVPKYTPPPPNDTTPTLLTGGSSQQERQYKLPKSAWHILPSADEWSLYLNLPDLPLWKAIALSLNISPPSAIRSGVNKDFDKRMRIAEAHMVPTGVLSHVARRNPASIALVRLADIARLAEFCTPKWELPSEFPAATVPAHAVSSPGNDSGKLGGQAEADLIHELRNDPIVGLHYRAEFGFGRHLDLDGESRKEYNKGIAERFKIWRYIPSEAIQLISENESIDKRSVLKNLEDDVGKKKLDAYEAKKMNKWNGEAPHHSRGKYLEVYWYGLNAWLDKNEPHITFRFGDPKCLSVDDKLTLQVAPAPPTVPAGQEENLSDETDLENIPGLIPRTGNGKLAVKAAWHLECKTRKTATARKVLALLIEWAKSGEEPELRVNQKTSHAVDWITIGQKQKTYHYDALEKTLGAWNKSRAKEAKERISRN